MNKLLFVLCFSATSFSWACTQVGIDYTGRPIYDCRAILNIREPEPEYHPADRGVDIHRPMRELLNEWEEQNKFNERMRNYENTKPLNPQRLQQ